MTVTCPEGHDSATADYCDQCGAAIAPPARMQPTEVLPAMTAVVAASTAAAEPETCPACAAPRASSDLFCEACGHDFNGPVPGTTQGGEDAAGPGHWRAVITADREQFELVAPDGLEFPESFEAVTLELNGDEVSIGRADAKGDPAVSRLHAILVRRSDGSYAIVDQGSTNGTTINDDRRPIAPAVPVPVADGDRIRIGAWTAIAIHRDQADGS